MKKRGGFAALFVEPEPDPRPLGTVQFADPATSRMAERINTFNEPESPACGKQRGFQPQFSSQSPWSQVRDGERAWSNMNRVRGVVDDSDRDGDDD